MSLVEPLRLGTREAPSRVVFGPHETNLGNGRALSERHVAYYERRARGGAGVIVVEEASVHASDWPYERCPLAAESRAGWADIATACHRHGSLVVAALGHAGGQGSSAYSQAAMWAPSRVPEVNTREVPKSMEPDDIDALVAGFAAAATAAVAAGCDGVEVNAGQFSLVRQFLSGLTNQRGDEWSDRSKLARDVLAAVRDAVGPDAIVGLRLSCDELAPWAGIVPEAGAALAAELAGPVDYVTVVRGAIFSAAATRPDGHVDPAFNLDLAAMVREAVRAQHGDRVAVIAQGSIVDVDVATAAVGDGRCDAVEMTRAQIADADLVTKVREGRVEQVRPCILCNQTCMVRDARNPIVTCVVDPRSGHELTDPEPGLHPAGGGRAVTVVGGGVAGLEAARVAALDGWSVRVVEREPKTGGMIRHAAAGSGRGRLAAIADWLAAECARLGVTVDTGTTVEVSELAAASAAGAAVIVAAGSISAPLDVSATRAAVVLDAVDVLSRGDDALPSGPVLVWDPIGGPIAVSIAERLGWAGRQVTLATPDNIVGNELSRSGDLAPANARLQQAGVVLERRSILRSIKKGAAVLEDRFSGERREVKAAAVVVCGHRLPDESVHRALEAAGVTAVRAGDAVAPRTLLEAVREGRAAVAALDGRVRVSDGVPMGTGGSGGHH
ncbi:MAG: mycofactocin system FadH/OYE family oxidoreductase 1 [Acidimicrobiales bacterium]